MIYLAWIAIFLAMGIVLAVGGADYHQIENDLRGRKAGLWHRYW